MASSPLPWQEKLQYGISTRELWAYTTLPQDESRVSNPYQFEFWCGIL